MDVHIKGFVYNYDEADIANLWKKHGLNLGKRIRGDFLITLTDHSKTVYINDFAGSKTLSIPRNSTIVVENNKIVHSQPTISTTDLWYVPPQGAPKRETYNMFAAAIENAVKIRIPEGRYSLALSSGHDSGAIGAAILKLGCADRCDVLYAYGNEHIETLEARIKLFPVTKEFKESREKMYSISSTIGSVESHTALAINTETKVLIMGVGADEMYVTQDYELMSDFFNQAELAYSHYNIEGRYPLCDPLVFREYYRLHHKLNSNFTWLKVPFKRYLKKMKFPYNPTDIKSNFYLW